MEMTTVWDDLEKAVHNLTLVPKKQPVVANPCGEVALSPVTQTAAVEVPIVHQERILLQAIKTLLIRQTVREVHLSATSVMFNDNMYVEVYQEPMTHMYIIRLRG